jgi:hypothetical protein
MYTKQILTMFPLQFFLLTSCVLFMVSVAANTVVIDFRAGDTRQGVFFQGNQEESELDLEADSFIGYVEPWGTLHNTCTSTPVPALQKQGP